MNSSGAVVIQKLAHEDEPARASLYDYLGPVEPHALFILGNLSARLPDSHLYAASRNGQWVGVAGYYGGPRGLNVFCTDDEASAALARHVAERHRPIEWLTGMGYAAWPAYEQVRAMGFQARSEPRYVFMERGLPDGALPVEQHEALVRDMRDDDAPRIAALLRYLQGAHDGSPITEQELARVRLNPRRLVLEVDGRVVSTAATNGIGIRAFQILGVATAPEVRGRGYARSVCAALIRRMRRQGARHCALFTDPPNAAARRCYHRLGFEVTGEFCLARLVSPEGQDSASAGASPSHPRPTGTGG